MRFIDNQDLNPNDQQLDVDPGLVIVDAGPSIPPVGANSGGVLTSYQLLAAPPGVQAADLAIVGSNQLFLTLQASVNGLYQLRLTITVLDQNLQPDVNNQFTNELGQVFGDVFINVRDVPSSPEALLPLFRGGPLRRLADELLGLALHRIVAALVGSQPRAAALAVDLRDQ